MQPKLAQTLVMLEGDEHWTLINEVHERWYADWLTVLGFPAGVLVDGRRVVRARVIDPPEGIA